jgi:diacylglycerol O-acyltransferase / wax synthase
MPTRTPMSSDDALWLELERPEQGTMVDGAFVFHEQVGVAEVQRVVTERVLDRYPVMRRRPVRTKAGWFWEDDESFDLDSHVFQAPLRSPDVEAVRRYMSRQRSTLVSPTHPMWSIHVIRNVRGLGSGRGSVVLTRFHHSIADGIRLVQVMMGLCDMPVEAVVPNVGKNLGQAGASSRAAQAARDIAKGAGEALGSATDAALGVPRRLAAVASDTADGAMRLASDPSGMLKGLPSAGATLATTSGGMVTTLFGRGASRMTRPTRLVEAAVALSSPENRLANTLGASVKLTLPDPTEATVWTGETGAHKGCSWCPPISMADVRAIRDRHPSSSVNDVLLAILAAALTAYLHEHGDTTVTSTGWFIPASIKPLDENLPEDLGNYFVGLVAELPVGIDDPGELLAQVSARMARIKNSDEAFLAFGLQKLVRRLPSPLADTVMQTLFDKINGSLVSVPGPRAEVSLAGHPVKSVLAFSPTVGNGPIVVTFFSYNGAVTAALTTDRRLVPDGNRLAQLITEQGRRMVSELAGRQPTIIDDPVPLPQP